MTGITYVNELGVPYTFGEILEFFDSLIDSSGMAIKLVYAPKVKTIILYKGTRSYKFVEA